MINCEKYKAIIPEQTCILRQKALKSDVIHKFDIPFAGCKGCKIGEQLLKKRGNTMEEQVCKTCKKTYPATAAFFDFAPRAFNGLTNDCKICRAKEKGEPTPDLHVEKQLVTPPPAPAKKKVKLKPSAERKILVINIESVPELWTALAEKADEEMRTPVAQALWILKEELI